MILCKRFLFFNLFSHKGHLEVVRYLLAHGADVHVKRELNLLATRGNHRLSRANLTYGDNPLSLAVKYGFEDIAIELVEHGSNILNENNEFEKSPLQDAIRLNRTRILNVFINKLKNTKAYHDNGTLLLQKKVIFFVNVLLMIK
jgi:ankyrin repeat protein